MKCNFKCRYYHISSSNGEYRVSCDLKGMEVKDIRDRTPDVYVKCNEYREKEKKYDRYNQEDARNIR